MFDRFSRSVHGFFKTSCTFVDEEASGPFGFYEATKVARGFIGEDCLTRVSNVLVFKLIEIGDRHLKSGMTPSVST